MRLIPSHLSHAHACRCLQVSQRVLVTDEPCIAKTKALMEQHPGALSLAQGIVHWQPPASALQAAMSALQSNPAVNGYGPAEGMPALREALKAKVAAQNGLENVSSWHCGWSTIMLGACEGTGRFLVFNAV